MTRALTRDSLAAGARALAERDRDLARLLARDGVPPLWARPPGFTTLLRIILEQQVSLASGREALKRLQAGVEPFTPERFLAVGAERIRTLGITRQKARYCVDLSRALRDGELRLRGLARLDDEDARAALVRVNGIGPWTADIYLLMAMRRPDVWPAGDLALVKAFREVKRLPAVTARVTDAWRPYRAVAARMLWQHYLRERG